MFIESYFIWLTSGVSNFYSKRLVILYPDIHFDLRYQYPGLLNKELRNLVCDEVEIKGYYSWSSLILTVFINVSRWLRKNWLFGKIVARLPLRDVLTPVFIGYNGLETGSEIQKKLHVRKPINWKAVHQKRLTVGMSEGRNERALSRLVAMGLPDGAPYACLYVRDDGFERRRSAAGSSVANADIQKFRKVVISLIEKGFFVVRVGDPTMVPVSFHDRFVDYVHTRFYSELTDLWLFGNCGLWIGTFGGLKNAPMLYSRPTISVNSVELPFGGLCMGISDCYIQKHIYSVAEKRFLSLKEQLLILSELPPSSVNCAGNYLYVENTPEEINQVFLDWFEAKEHLDYDWNLRLQSQFHDLRQEMTKKTFYDSETNQWANITVEMYQHLRPKMGRSFLENCWEYGEYLEKLRVKYSSVL